MYLHLLEVRNQKENGETGLNALFSSFLWRFKLENRENKYLNIYEEEIFLGEKKEIKIARKKAEFSLLASWMRVVLLFPNTI